VNGWARRVHRRNTRRCQCWECRWFAITGS
jgi:hypothetical protein